MQKNNKVLHMNMEFMTSKFVFISCWIFNRISETLRLTKEGIKEHLIHHSFAISVYFIALLENYLVGKPVPLRMSTIFSFPILFVMSVMMIFSIALHIYRLWRMNYAGSAILSTLIFIRDDLFSSQRLSNTIHTFLFMSIFITAFSHMKILIPFLHPFSWDWQLMRVDQIIHFGKHPYEIIQPIFGLPLLTSALNFSYHSWYFIMFAAWIWQGFSKEQNNVRLKFLFSFMLTWFVGTCIIGVLFSSVGPCYYRFVCTGEDPFAPLMEYLYETSKVVPIWALAVQEGLWKYYTTRSGLVIHGISAMPSMHVATIVLLSYLGFEARKPGWDGFLYALL